MNDSVTQNTPEQPHVQALAWMNAPIPRMYANGFVIAQSNSDFSLVMMLNGAPTAVVNMSFTSAKTLGEELGKALNNLERGIEQKILSMDEVTTKMGMTRHIPQTKYTMNMNEWSPILYYSGVNTSVDTTTMSKIISFRNLLLDGTMGLGVL
jgi:hypothetical protein